MSRLEAYFQAFLVLLAAILVALVVLARLLWARSKKDSSPKIDPAPAPARESELPTLMASAQVPSGAHWDTEESPKKSEAGTSRKRQREAIVLISTAVVVLGVIIAAIGYRSDGGSQPATTDAQPTNEYAQRIASHNQEAQRIASHYQGFNHFQTVDVRWSGADTLSLREKSSDFTIDTSDVVEIVCKFHLDQKLFHKILVWKLNGDQVTFNLPLQHTDGSYVECPTEQSPAPGPPPQAVAPAEQPRDTAVINKFIAGQEDQLHGEEFKEARTFVAGDLNHDGIPDVAVLYTIENEGGGNNYIQHLAVFLRIDGNLVPASQVEAGGKWYRSVRLESIEDNIILLRTSEYGPNDPSCCPSEAGTARFVLEDGKLQEVKAN